MEEKNSFIKKDLLSILLVDIVLFGSMVAIFFIDKKFNTLTYLVKKFLE